jgi:Na+-driven multidrug efflux pump
LISLFNLSPEAHEAAKSFLRVHCISMAVSWPLSFGLSNALRAAGDARYVMIVATVSMWSVRVSAAYLFVYPLGIGLLGVWHAMGADFAVRGTWQTKRVIENK